MGRRWTDQDIEELKGLAQRYSPSKIAELTDRSMGAIIFKAHKLKLSLQSRRKLENPSPSGARSMQLSHELLQFGERRSEPL